MLRGRPCLMNRTAWTPPSKPGAAVMAAGVSTVPGAGVFCGVCWGKKIIYIYIYIYCAFQLAARCKPLAQLLCPTPQIKKQGAPCVGPFLCVHTLDAEAARRARNRRRMFSGRVFARMGGGGLGTCVNRQLKNEDMFQRKYKKTVSCFFFSCVPPPKKKAEQSRAC